MYLGRYFNAPTPLPDQKTGPGRPGGEIVQLKKERLGNRGKSHVEASPFWGLGDTVGISPTISGSFLCPKSLFLCMCLLTLFSVYRFPRSPREGGTKSSPVGVGGLGGVLGAGS